KLIDLGDEPGSAANAQQVGDQFLAQHATPPNAGTLTVARRIRDLDTGRMVEPYEIRPGELVRVRGTRPYPDSLNASARDGVTVFRLVQTDWSDSDGTCRLSLDNPRDSTTNAVNRAIRKR